MRGYWILFEYHRYDHYDWHGIPVAKLLLEIHVPTIYSELFLALNFGSVLVSNFSLLYLDISSVSRDFYSVY